MTADGTAIRADEVTDRAVAAERHRIAQILHDDVLQAFAVCLLKSQLCQRLHEKGQIAPLGKELESLEEALNEAVDRVRELNASLKQQG